MAIEGTIGENYGLEKKSQLPDPISGPFNLNAPIIAGTIKVTHPLMGKTEFLIVGFVVEDAFMTQEEFSVQGSQTISYKSVGGNFGKNRIIYQKMIIDNKSNHFSKYFKDDTVFTYRNRSTDSPFNLKKVITNGQVMYLYNYGKYSMGEISTKPYVEYYMYEKINSENPECGANVVYALCKYRENSEFKYAIFNFFELRQANTE